MDDDAHIGLVDTHAESVGGHHHAHLVVLPFLLSFVPHLRVESGVVVEGADTVFHEQFCNLLGAFATSDIDNGTAFHRFQDVEQLLILVGGLSHDIGQIFPLVTHAEYIEATLRLGFGGRLLRGRQLQSVLNVLNDFGSCRGGECQYGRIGL